MSRFIVIFGFVAFLIVISPILLIGGALLFDYLRSPSQVRDLIPAKIETRGVASNDFSQQIGGGGDCGGLSFKLSQKTIYEVKTQGLDYFKNLELLIPETNYRDKKNSWKAWQKAPVPSGEGAQAYLLSGDCVRDFEKFLKENNLSIKTDTEAYYTYVTHRGFSNLWLFPEWGIIAYSYFY